MAGATRDQAAPKAELRSRLLAARARRSPADIDTARGLVAAAALAHLSEISPLECVAAYEPLRTEPGSARLLSGLAERGIRVLVPLLRADRDLDWTEWPTTGSPLGVAEITAAQVVIVPALAVDSHGNRLGRGGGSYDRALARVRPGAVIVALLFDEEIVDLVPTDAWDRRVAAAVTPGGWRDLGDARSGG